MRKKYLATVYAIAAAVLYAINVPFSKMLLRYVAPTMMAAFLYLGAGWGLFVYSAVSKAAGKASPTEPLTKKELPYTIAMVVLDIAAPILLMFGIKASNAANVSLINNFEIVATSIIALLIFKEIISKRLWLAIALVTAASVMLTFEGSGAFEFNIGSLFVFGACLCRGFENKRLLLGCSVSGGCLWHDSSGRKTCNPVLCRFAGNDHQHLLYDQRQH